MENKIPENCRALIKRNMDRMRLSPEETYPHDTLTFYFLLTQDCNGGCPYCYQPKQFRKKISMSKKIVDDTMDFVLDNFKEDKVKFCFFGGEPFLEWDMMKYVLESYQSMNFHVITNGIVMHERKDVRDVLLKESFHLNVNLSVEPLTRRIGIDNFIDKISDDIEVLKASKGEAHIVITDPTQDWIYPLTVELLEKNVPKVRVSIARQLESVLQHGEEFFELMKKIADYVYFREEPMWNRMSFDQLFNGNIFRKMVGFPINPLPPTMCGCGYAYLAVDHKGDIYPCDWFSSFPEFKVGSIYTGLNDNARLFYEANNWIDGLYEDCKDCPIGDDIRLCPRAMCLAENYQAHGNPLKPTKTHCAVNLLEYRIYKYIAEECIKRGYDKKYKLGMKRR